uniref:Uncharacterized protein n=1 Tax=Panagrolaimus sp. PS1159 TaxID=55785 RepID=A0AC35GUQ5_9BILA
MAFFDKPIKFKNFQASSADYHLYKTRDEDNMHMIELCDDTDPEFIYRLRLTTKELDKIRRENKIDDSIRYIQKFVTELSEEKWITCKTNAEGKRYNDKKRENEEQKKKAKAYEKKIRHLEAEVEETKNMKNELTKKKLDNLDFLYKEVLADYETERKEVIEHLEDKKDLKREFENLKREYDITEDEADELVKERKKLEAENDELKRKCKQLT